MHLRCVREDVEPISWLCGYEYLKLTEVRIKPLSRLVFDGLGNVDLLDDCSCITTVQNSLMIVSQTQSEDREKLGPEGNS